MNEKDRITLALVEKGDLDWPMMKSWHDGVLRLIGANAAELKCLHQTMAATLRIFKSKSRTSIIDLARHPAHCQDARSFLPCFCCGDGP